MMVNVIAVLHMHSEHPWVGVWVMFWRLVEIARAALEASAKKTSCFGLLPLPPALSFSTMPSLKY